MAIFILACKEIVTRVKKLLIWMVLLPFKFVGWFHQWYRFNGNLMVSNNISVFYRGMRIKATIVTYAFSVQCFENATIVTYAGLRVNKCHTNSHTSSLPYMYLVAQIGVAVCVLTPANKYTDLYAFGLLCLYKQRYILGLWVANTATQAKLNKHP